MWISPSIPTHECLVTLERLSGQSEPFQHNQLPFSCFLRLYSTVIMTSQPSDYLFRTAEAVGLSHLWYSKKELLMYPRTRRMGSAEISHSENPSSVEQHFGVRGREKTVSYDRKSGFFALHLMNSGSIPSVYSPLSPTTSNAWAKN